ncbi:mercury resistance system transport protein MerF [Aquicoccus sp. SCR17]|nr:mercury resistance system transport protein MerF [Carideicomes alvinocaridis]
MEITDLGAHHVEVVAALCCFTPILVILLGTGWLDIVLLPALAVFIGITLYALWRRQRTY